MRDQILTLLTTKFEGVSSAILGRIADKLGKTATTQEQATAAVEAYTLQQVIDSFADSRATEATQTAVRNYETKHGLKDGQKINTNTTANPNDTTGGGDQTAGAGGADTALQQQLNAIIESNKKLEQRLAHLDTERITANRRQQLNDVIGKLPEGLRRSYERTQVDSLDDEQFATLLGDITTEVDGIVKEVGAKGAVFGRPAAGAGTGDGAGGAKLSEEQLKAISHRDWATGEGQPF